MKRLLTVLVVTLALASNTLSAYAYTASIESVSDDGLVIVMDDSSVWLVEDVDQVDSQLWLPAEDVVFAQDSSGRCVYANSIILVNTDEHESVCARRVR